MPLLEVIALTAADAEAAEAGGADRIEAVADMQSGGLSPDPDTVAGMRRVTSLPIRVMLRARTGFRTSRPELERLCRAAGDHAEAGADGFVFGFLEPGGGIDTEATTTLAAAVSPLPWTFHRAVDHAACPEAALEALRALPGLDAVLSAGSARGVDVGMRSLLRRAAEHAPVMLVGGGLRRKHVALLAAAGVGAFHVGTGVRARLDGRVGVDAGLVRGWRGLVDASPD
jgi:copper homeostasis protein